MKIELLKDTELEDGKHRAGETLEVISEIACQLIATESAKVPTPVNQAGETKEVNPIAMKENDTKSVMEAEPEKPEPKAKKERKVK